MNAERIRETFLIALEQHRKGNLVEAENAYRQIIEFAPDHAGSIHYLGLINYQRGLLGNAVSMYRQALAIAPDFDEAYNNLGVALEAQGKLNEARDAYQHALRLNPTFATAYNNLGDVFRRQQRLPEAENVYREAIRLEPRNPLALVNLGNALWGQGRLREAEEAFRQAIQCEPDYADAYNNLGNFLSDQGRVREAELAHRKAVQLSPRRAEFHSDLGLVLGHQGRGCDAQDSFRQALQIRPEFAKVYWQLGPYHKYDSANHQDVAQIRKLLDSSNLDEADAMYLHFALGKIYDDCRKYDDAFVHYKHANRIRRGETNYDSKEFADSIAQTIETFSRKFLTQQRGYGETSERPVFVVGMPRSGTTLVEQIVASHPAVFGAGELITMREIVSSLASQAVENEPYPRCVKTLDRDSATTLARYYQAHSERYAGSGVSRVVDKTPSNFLHLGLIALLFPNARIIHCRRSPLDTCLSMYFHNFADVTEAAYDLSDMGSYYRQYERLMEHWRTVLPLKMLDVQYEHLVLTFDEVAHQLVDFLGLPWNEHCLTYYRNPRSVSTSSSWQVRQPVYSSSVDRWRNYEKHLGPLMQSLAKDVVMDLGGEQ
jgi:tetratricopeptide (TPR) repeat protein